MKIRRASFKDGSFSHWLYFCPACEAPHQLDKRWTFNGDMDKPTFRNSVLVHPVPAAGIPKCHSYITDGVIAYLADCTHAMAGKSVPIPEWPWPTGSFGGIDEP